MVSFVNNLLLSITSDEKTLTIFFCHSEANYHGRLITSATDSYRKDLCVCCKQIKRINTALRNR